MAGHGMADMPLDILRHCFIHLESVHWVIHCALVCSHWRMAVESDEVLSFSLSLSSHFVSPLSNSLLFISLLPLSLSLSLCSLFLSDSLSLSTLLCLCSRCGSCWPTSGWGDQERLKYAKLQPHPSLHEETLGQELEHI